MADSSLDIVLNAIDRTGPAVDSGIANLDRFGSAAQSLSDAQAGGGGGGFISEMIGSLFSFSGVAAVAATAAVGLGVAIATNVGGIRDTIVSFAASAGSAVMSMFGAVGEAISSTIGSMVDGTFDWGNLFKTIVELAATGFAVLEFGFKNWEAVGTLALTSIELALVKFANETEYYLTEVIPAWLTWFWENWRDIFQTIWDFTKTVVSNMYENLVNFFSAVMSWIHGDGFDFEWTSLTDGFESSIKELPKILDREKGPLEKQLEGIVGDLSKGLGEGLQDNVNKRVNQVDKLLPNLGDKLKGFASSIFGSDLFKSIFGIKDDQKNVQAALPGLVNERFTTGVGASGQEDVAMQALNEQKKQTGFLAAIGDFLGTKLNPTIKAGVQAAAQGAPALGIPLTK
jgi:hypothetical protein